MTAFRIAAQMIAYQPVEAIEILPHVRRAGRNIYPRRRSKPEHQLRPVQYDQQTFQCFRIESTTYFDPTPATQFNDKSTVAPRDAVDIPCRGGNHFDGNKSPALRLASTMHAMTIFIQRPYSQATLLAKRRPRQSTRFKLRNKDLNLGQTTSSVLHSHFAHSSSATLNTAQEQSALLGRILKMLDVYTDSTMPGGSFIESRPTEAATTNHQTSTNSAVPPTPAPKTPGSKFDPKNYRQAQTQKTEEDGGWGRKQQTVIPVRKPSKKQFVHAYPSADYRAEGMPTIEDEATGEIYLLSAGLDLPVDIENKVDPHS